MQSREASRNCRGGAAPIDMREEANHRTFAVRGSNFVDCRVVLKIAMTASWSNDQTFKSNVADAVAD